MRSPARTKRLHVVVGNSASPAERPDYFSWRLEINCAVADTIAAVTYQLHPTFKENVVCLPMRTGAATVYSRWYQGWGTFEIVLWLHLGGGGAHRVIHELCLSPGAISRPPSPMQLRAITTAEHSTE